MEKAAALQLIARAAKEAMANERQLRDVLQEHYAEACTSGALPAALHQPVLDLLTMLGLTT